MRSTGCPHVTVSGPIATLGTRGSMILLLFTTSIPKLITVYDGLEPQSRST